MTWQRFVIGDFLNRIKEPVSIKPIVDYCLVTIRMNHKGVTVRSRIKGSEIKSSTLFKVQKGQFILSGIDARNGAFGIVPEDLEGAVISNDFWTHAINKDVIDLEYFYWYTSTQEFYSICIAASEGTTNRQRLQAAKFYNFQLNLPSLAEQREIVKRINQTNIGLTDLTLEIEKQQTYLRQLRQSILQEAVHGKLVPQDPNDEPASELLKKIKAEKEKLTADGKMKKEKMLSHITPEEIPFELPKGWVWCRLSQLAEIGTGATPLTTNSAYYNGKIPWITSSATGELFVVEPEKFISELALKDTNCKVYPKGTLIVAMYGQGKTRGQITELLIDAATNQACAAIELHFTNESHKKYIKYYFQKIYLEIRELAAGGAQPNLNLQKIKHTFIPLPPRTEQTRIVDKIEKLFHGIKNLQLNITHSQGEAEHLLQAVLREAFNGHSNKYDIEERLKRIGEPQPLQEPLQG